MFKRINTVIGLCFLALSATLSGCSGRKQGAYYWKDGPLSEISLTSDKDYLEKNKLNLRWESEYILSSDAVWKLIAATNEARENKTYYLFYSFDEKKWELLDAGEGVTQDERKYEFLGMPFVSVSGEPYAIINQETEGKGIARVSKSGVGEYNGAVHAGYAKPNAKMILGRDGAVYEWLNSGENIYLSDAKKNVAKLHCLNSDVVNEVVIDGWIMGAVQKNASDDIYFYGMDRERKPTMWNRHGDKYKVAFPRDLTPTEYCASYDETGELFFCDKYGIWGEGNGEEGHCLFSFMENGYQFDAVCGMVCTGENTLRILMNKDENPVVLSYDINKKNQPQEKKELILASYMPNAAFNSIVADFNRQDHEYYVSVRLPEKDEDRESFQKRIQLELSAGNGPDLLEQSAIFATESMINKGFVLSLNVDEFGDSDCLKSCLETGMVGDKLYGIPYEFSLDFAAWRTGEIENTDGITMDAVIQGMQASKRKILDANCSLADIVVRYALRDESNTDYIDWKQRKSKLTETEFLKLLEFAKKYAADDVDYEEARKNAFAMSPMGGAFTFGDFQILAECMGNYTILGYPRKEGKGIYVWTNKIYISSKSKSTEGAIRFLRYLVSERAQTLYASYDVTGDAERKADERGLFIDHTALFPVNRSVLEKMVLHEDGNQPENQFVLDSGKVIYLKQPLSEKQITEFWYMVDQAIPANYKIEDVEGLVYEELDAYFYGQSTTAEVAEKLDRRIQLYLDENP